MQTISKSDIEMALSKATPNGDYADKAAILSAFTPLLANLPGDNQQQVLNSIELLLMVGIIPNYTVPQLFGILNGK